MASRSLRYKQSPTSRRLGSKTKKMSRNQQTSILVKYNWGSLPRRWSPLNMPRGWKHIGGGTSFRGRFKKDEEFRGPSTSRGKARTSLNRSLMFLKSQKVVKSFSVVG